MESGETSSAAQRLAACKDQVLREWARRVRGELPAAAAQPDPILIDTLPAFLNLVTEALTVEHPRTNATEGSTFAQEHAGERVRLTDFRLEDLVREYQVLRDVLFDVLGRQAPLTPEERHAITVSIDSTTREACAAFTLVVEGLRRQVMLTLAHDLRGPLSAARAGAALILRRPESPSVSRWAARVDDNLERVDAMIRTLLDVSRTSGGGRLPLQLAPCDLVAIVSEVIQMLELSHGERFELSAPSTLEGFWSSEYLRRAMENLLSNAIKYGDPVRPVSIMMEPLYGRVVVSVHNDGKPIPIEEQETLFQAFHRSRQADNSGVRGWGLGLPLVRAVAEAHGGSISIDSMPETGTTFTLDIPIDARPFQEAPVTP